MKRLFAKASKPFVLYKSSSEHGPSEAHAATAAGIHPAGQVLQPKYVVPPVPHPCPHDHLALLPTKSGLLIRRHPSDQLHLSAPLHYVCVSWGKTVKIEEISEDSNDDDIEWDEAVVVYGIIGVLELFSSTVHVSFPYRCKVNLVLCEASHLLVITSRTEVGNLIDVSHMIYGVKAVAAIPLIEDKARIALNMLASRRAHLTRPSLLPVSSRDPEDEDDIDTSALLKDVPKVQFSSGGNQVKMLLMDASSSHQDLDPTRLDAERPHSPMSIASDISTPVSDHGTSPAISVANALASKLSFWATRQKSRPSGRAADIRPEADEASARAQEVVENISPETQEEPLSILKNIVATIAPTPLSTEDQHSEVEGKIIRECVREFTKGGMYFAYTFDITRSLQHKQEQLAKVQKQRGLLSDLNSLPSPERSGSVDTIHTSPLGEPNPTLPLWRRVDRRFWWNEWLSRPFVDAGLHSYVLPVMQGYCQMSNFVVPPDPLTNDEDVAVEFAIISRRSKYRAGLRYQRRGIDEDANVANFVETETIMRVERLGSQNIFTFVQIRGSIPLFWTQIGYGLKPPPVLAPDRSHAQNLEAIKRHFNKTIPLYGPHTVVNLAEQHGKEGPISQEYREYMQELSSPEVQYCEYDFHAETKGMKYENIDKLIQAMERTFDLQGFLWISGNTIMSQQQGVYRINCIDCLDRTNVVQSAFARYVLNRQLGAVGLHNPQSDGRAETDVIFNDVWANNGDAISRAYAGTSALKGDFTRTGKRDLSGLLNDGVNSLARMYSSTFGDWFSQAVIDFMLGNRTITVFSEFLLKLQSTDPRDLVRLSKIRAEAIATSVSRVLPEGERLLCGWTLFAPAELNTRVCDKFEEKVLLLSAKALYVVSYDYTLEKVKIYTRVPLWDIVQITKGAYILSPLEEASRDPCQNAGFVVTWRNSNQITRMSSYSVRNSVIDSVSTVGTAKRLSTGMKSSLGGINLNPAAVSSSVQQLMTRSLNRRPTVLANVLNKAGLASQSGEMTFAAFKVLPIDPARVRMASSSPSVVSVGDENVEYTEAADELSGARNCEEAVEMIVDCIRKACEEVGSTKENFVREEDVVGLQEAQRMTSVYAKMEYGVKRLLWLGG